MQDAPASAPCRAARRPSLVPVLGEPAAPWLASAVVLGALGLLIVLRDRSFSPELIVALVGLTGTLTAAILEPAECDALLDRYVDKLVASDRPGTPASEIVELQRQAREKAKDDPAFKDCRSAVSRKKFECAMAAETVDRMEICLL